MPANIISSELLKLKRNYLISALIFFPSFVIMTLTIIIFAASSFFTKLGANIWYIVYSNVFYIFAFLYPILAILFMLSLHEVEIKAKSYKHLFTIPIKRRKYYFVKILIFLFYLFLSLVLSFSTLILSGNILQYFNPDFSFFDYDVIGIFSAYFFRAFFYLSSIAILHFSLYLWKNYLILNVIFALLMLSIGLIISFSDSSYYFLYSSPFQDAFNLFKIGDEFVQKHLYFDILYFIIFAIIGLQLFKRIKT